MRRRKIRFLVVAMLGQDSDQGSAPAITPTPAAWQVEIMFANWSLLPRFEVRMYETGW